MAERLKPKSTSTNRILGEYGGRRESKPRAEFGLRCASLVDPMVSLRHEQLRPLWYLGFLEGTWASVKRLLLV
jgi:hypothetical protein